MEHLNAVSLVLTGEYRITSETIEPVRVPANQMGRKILQGTQMLTRRQMVTIKVAGSRTFELYPEKEGHQQILEAARGKAKEDAQQALLVRHLDAIYEAAI